MRDQRVPDKPRREVGALYLFIDGIVTCKLK